MTQQSQHSMYWFVLDTDSDGNGPKAREGAIIPLFISVRGTLETQLVLSIKNTVCYI